MSKPHLKGLPGKPHNAPPPTQMSFLDHLGELRKRLFHVVAALAIGFSICYPFADKLFALLSRPLRLGSASETAPLIYTGPLEVFVTFMKLSLLAGLLLVLPYLFLQVWLFIAPALRAKEKRLALPFVLLTTLFFIGGVVFGYLVVLPLAYEFLLQYAPAVVDAQIRVAEYFTLTIRMLLAFGILFELPVVVLLLVYLRLLSTKALAKQWRVVIVGVLIVSAILTPADPMTMVLLAAPLTLLFFLSLALSFFLEKSRSKGSA